MKRSANRGGGGGGGGKRGYKSRGNKKRSAKSNNNNGWGPDAGNSWKKKRRTTPAPLPTKKERRLQRSHGVVVEEAKVMWNKARNKATSKSEKSKVVDSIMEKLGEALSDIATRHDSARVIQFCVQFGSEKHRVTIVNALKPRVVELCKMTHGRFVVQKLFDYCKQEDSRRPLLKALERHVVALSVHSTGALVLEHLFLKSLSTKEQRWLFQEFYGPEFKHFKREKRGTLSEILSDEPKKRDDILSNLTNISEKHAEKGLLSMSFVQELLANLFEHADYKAALRMLPYVKEVAPALCSTRKGVVALVFCIAYGSAKDRKRIIKCFKDDLFKDNEAGLAEHPFAHLALVKLLDVMDDTKLITKHVLSGVLGHLERACDSLYARKLLLHVLTPKSSKYFAPSDISLLEKRFRVSEDGEKIETSKKDAETRQGELLKFCHERLEAHCESNVTAMLNRTYAKDVLVETMAQWKTSSLVESVANAAVSIVEDDEESTPILNNVGHRTLQRLIQHDGTTMFAPKLVEAMKKSEGGVSFWAKKSNRSAFVVLALLKNASTSSVVRASLTKKDLSGTGASGAGLKALLSALD